MHFSKPSSKKYQSFLWGSLNKLLIKNNLRSNWFHFFVPSSQVKTINEAKIKLTDFNRSQYENHLILNSYIKRSSILFLLFEYTFVYFKVLLFFDFKKNFQTYNISKCNFYEFLKKDLYKSFCGDSLIYNIFNIKIIDELLKNMPKQKLGFFLFENQSWEKCLIKLWRKYNHGKLIACINSTIRFWDLRYFKTKKEFISKSKNPDYYLFNSTKFKNTAVNNFYPRNKCLVVEALRYNHLKGQKAKKNNKVLLVGDINFLENERLLLEFSKITKKLKKNRIFFKPHPTNSFKKLKQLSEKYQDINFLDNTKENSFTDYEFIICTNGTSAIIDCIIINAKYRIMKFNDLLNLNPLDNNYKNQVDNADQMYKFIQDKKNLKKAKNILMLDNSLKKWKNLIINLS